jgi:indole-3-glycerol phosphate synthase
MTDILKTIAARTVERVAERKAKKSLEAIKSEAMEKCNGESDFPFEKALRKDGIAVICEVKKASPSKGILDPEFLYCEIAEEYEAAGADAVSVLTEPDWFLGDDRYLSEIREIIRLPILRKDFTVDSYQIYEAKLIGADAILLICALLEPEKLKQCLDTAHQLGLSAVVEAHTEEEVLMAVKAGARIIGVNNRDLRTFQVDINTSIRLRSLVPEDIIFISESGIKTNEDIAKLRENNIDAVLIGETLMRSEDKKKQLSELKGL